MKRKFRWCYIGVNDQGDHWGRLTNLDTMRKQIGRYRPVGSHDRVMTSGVSRDDLMNKVTQYLQNYPGSHDVELRVGGEIETIKGVGGE